MAWRSRLRGALMYGILGGAAGFLGGLVAGQLLACPLHVGGNLCGMVAVFVFPPAGAALVGASGMVLGILREQARPDKPTSN